MKKKQRKNMYILCYAILSISLLTGCNERETNLMNETNIDNETIIPEFEGYTLLWNDEFNEKEVNTDIWNYELHEPGWVNQELQEYTSSNDNVYLENGNLIIKAVKTTDDSGMDYYTSGRMTTQNKKDLLYGKVL